MDGVEGILAGCGMGEGDGCETEDNVDELPDSSSAGGAGNEVVQLCGVSLIIAGLWIGERCVSFGGIESCMLYDIS